VVASYLWSPTATSWGSEASSAYAEWGRPDKRRPGVALDIGAAVGRFAFRDEPKYDFVVGSTIPWLYPGGAGAHAPGPGKRWRCRRKGISRARDVGSADTWQTGKVEFIVEMPWPCPFDPGVLRLASLNIADKGCRSR